MSKTPQQIASELSDRARRFHELVTQRREQLALRRELTDAAAEDLDRQVAEIEALSAMAQRLVEGQLTVSELDEIVERYRAVLAGDALRRTPRPALLH
ncbi:hypothetical protein [Methylobacterium oxalidis]|uniref:hypothetical protein n=1 Tax=Methylobacterium oxalidis TaxID=944322 RepID=UPI003314D384